MAMTIMRGCLIMAMGVCAAEIGAAAPPRPQSAQVGALTGAYNASGHDLFVALAGRPGNVVFSPSSVGTAMAMALSGARGATASEMAAVLHHTLSPVDVERAHAGWMAALGGSRTAAPTATPPVTLVTANGLMVANGATVSPLFVAALRNNFAAEVLEHATVESVNGWVSRKTAGKIDRILDRIDPHAAAVIVNATYFKAAWATPFDPRGSRPAVFHLSPSATAPVPTMYAQSRYAVMTGDGYRAIRLPYAGDTLAMIVVLPNDLDGADAVAGRLTGDRVAQMSAALHGVEPALVSLALPRVKTAFAARLAGVFTRLGMTAAFNPAVADFSGMTGRPPRELPMAISEIVHRAVIEVTEEGTEAAAATGLVPRTTALRPLPQPFIVDRPFLFYIVDGATGAIVFQGRIADPRAAGGVD
jgi:serpin B